MVASYIGLTCGLLLIVYDSVTLQTQYHTLSRSGRLVSDYCRLHQSSHRDRLKSKRPMVSASCPLRHRSGFSGLESQQSSKKGILATGVYTNWGTSDIERDRGNTVPYCSASQTVRGHRPTSSEGTDKSPYTRNQSANHLTAGFFEILSLGIPDLWHY